MEPAQIHPEGVTRVSVDIQNTGARAGTETVQLHIHETAGAVATLCA
jgi:hypothetical protein